MQYYSLYCTVKTSSLAQGMGGAQFVTWAWSSLIKVASAVVSATVYIRRRDQSLIFQVIRLHITGLVLREIRSAEGLEAMEIDLEVSKSLLNVSTTSDKAVLINKSSPSIFQEPTLTSKSYDPNYEAPIHTHNKSYMTRSYSSDMFTSERSLDSDSLFTASGASEPGDYSGSVPMHSVKSYGAVGVSTQNGTVSAMTLTRFDPFPVDVTCTECHRKVETKLAYRPGKVTFLLGAALTPILCCFLPCFLNLTKDVHHKCPNCGVTLGVYKRSCYVPS